MNISRVDNAVNNFLSSTFDKDIRHKLFELIRLADEGRRDIVAFSEKILGVPLNDFQKKFLTRTTTPREEWANKFGDDIEDIGGMLFGKNIAYPSNQVW